MEGKFTGTFPSNKLIRGLSVEYATDASLPFETSPSKKLFGNASFAESQIIQYDGSDRMTSIEPECSFATPESVSEDVFQWEAVPLDELRCSFVFSFPDLDNALGPNLQSENQQDFSYSNFQDLDMDPLYTELAKLASS